ncbi:hypothetical protein CSAL01_12576 [Colletotrichum salicis]|uniref:Uncharacterized protein n=1 Tax=Colletotrichum salicis TaxID=1209931 RepID=A0A135U0F7_9PEZI|nr:hypothetical protein CSAL01_12576 [Colletotrichum salicis]
MLGENAAVSLPRNQQDSHQQENISSSLDDVVEALQNQPPGPDDSSQDTSALSFCPRESNPHQANILPSPSTMSTDIRPQRTTSPSLSPRDSEIEQDLVDEHMPPTAQEPAIDEALILSQEQPVSSEQPLLGSADSKSESRPSTSLRVHAPFWKLSSSSLASYDNHTLPKWRLKITLNTFLAFFTTLAKGAFMLPVSTTLSQSKFTWFLKPNSLYDFYILDQASRGWLGSMKLLFRVRFKHTVAIGAVLMVVSIISFPNPMAIEGNFLEGTDNNTSLLNTKIASFFLIYNSPLSPNKTHVVSSDTEDDYETVASMRDFEYEAREAMFHICVQTFGTSVRTGRDDAHISGTFSQIDNPRKGFVLETKCSLFLGMFENCTPLNDPGDLVAQITPPDPGTRKFSFSYASMWDIAFGIAPYFQYEQKYGVRPTRRSGPVNTIGPGSEMCYIATSISSALRTTHHQDQSPGVVVIKGTPLKEVSLLQRHYSFVIVITAQSAKFRKRGPKDVYKPADVKESALATLIVLSNDCREVLSDGLQPAGVLQKTSKKNASRAARKRACDCRGPGSTIFSWRQ